MIPKFQREYSWDKKNYQEFFEDMMNNLVASNGVINDDQYFLGTMLFVGDFAEKPDKPIEVVDGQQRLTTITILFSVLSDRFRELGEDTLSKQLFNYIMTTDDNGKDVRVLQSKSSYPYFVYYIQDREKLIKTEPSTEEAGSETVGMGTFFRHYWISKYKRCNASILYDSFNKLIVKNEASYRNFLEDLLKNAKKYLQIINPRREDYNNRKEYFWLVQSLNTMNKTFNVVQTRIALLALYDVKENNLISTEQFKRAILAMENFHFAFTAVCSMRTNNLETLYSRFAIALRKCNSKSEANKVIDEKLIIPLNKLYPSYDVFASKFKELLFTKKDDPVNIKSKYAVYKLNCYFSDKEVFEDDGSIEHILAETSGEQALNIGNLILVAGALATVYYKEILKRELPNDKMIQIDII